MLDYTITFNVLSEEPYEGTRVQDQVVLRATIIEFHDMQISLDPLVESKIKTTAPSRIVRYTLNVSNYGNVADQPTIHNHTYDDVNKIWSVSPGLGSLSTWEIDYALLEGFGSEFPLEKPCVELTVEEENQINQQTSQGQGPDYCYVTAGNTITLPMMEPYTTLQLVVIVTVAPDASLVDRNLGIKVLSMHGSLTRAVISIRLKNGPTPAHWIPTLKGSPTIPPLIAIRMSRYSRCDSELPI